MAEPTPEFAAAVEAAGLLRSEYPDQMAVASCTCEPTAVCGAHRLLGRYQEMYDRLVTVQAERRAERARAEKAEANLARITELVNEADRERDVALDAVAAVQAAAARAEAERDAALNARCPRCGEWVRDFPAVRAATEGDR